MKKEECEKLAAGSRVELDVTKVDVVRLNGHGAISPRTNAAFVATAEFRLTEAGNKALRDWGPCKEQGAPGVTIVKIKADGNVVCPLESDEHQPDIEAWLRQHFVFEWQLNGRASAVPHVDYADGAVDESLVQHPWVCVLDPAGIRTQIFDLDCVIKTIHPGERKVKPHTTILTSGELPYEVEIVGKVQRNDLVGKTLRVPVVIDGIDHDAFLVLRYDHRVSRTAQDDDDDDGRCEPKALTSSSSPPAPRASSAIGTVPPGNEPAHVLVETTTDERRIIETHTVTVGDTSRP